MTGVMTARRGIFCYNHLQLMSGPRSPANSDQSPIDLLAGSLAGEMVPLGRNFAYVATLPLVEEDLNEYLHEPIAALPIAVCEAIGPVRIVLAPYLIRTDGLPAVVQQAPAMNLRLRSAYMSDQGNTLFFSVKEENPSEYHQIFFNTLAHLLTRKLDKNYEKRYTDLLAAEFEQHVNGEVDEPSWELKQALPEGGNGNRTSKRGKLFREYSLQSFTDTMTLYMHGICCDIDVEPGPRQVPSRWLRKRIEALYEMFPPPNNRPVLPEHLARR
jgi:hypothetical protein